MLKGSKKNSRSSNHIVKKTMVRKNQFEKVNFAKNSCEHVYGIRFKEGVQGIYVENYNKTKSGFVNFLAKDIRDNEESVEELGINLIGSQKDRTDMSGNTALQDNLYPRKIFIKCLPHAEENTSESLIEFGKEITTRLNSYTYKFPTRFKWECEKHSNGSNLLALDESVINEDVSKVAFLLYEDYIVDGTFFDNADTVENFFSHTTDPRSLFEQFEG